MKRDLVEFYAPRIGIGVVALALLVFIVVEAKVSSRERHCTEATREIESFERCDAHTDCLPTREDMLVVIESEGIIERYCPKDEERV